MIEKKVIFAIGARRDWSYALWSTSLFAIVLGTTAAAFSEQGLELEARLLRYFPDGPWRVAGLGILLCGLLALVLALLRRIVSWVIARQDLAFESLETDTIDTTLENVRTRVQRFMQRREPDASQALDTILRGALLLKASDLHLTPAENSAKITYRVDGVLHQLQEVSPLFAARIAGRVKVLASLDSFSNKPQDGSLRRVLGDLRLEARVSCLPANNGDRIVLRIARGQESIPELSKLGFDGGLVAQLQALLLKPQGVLYVSGPVGSGKTTTLYSCLKYLHEQRGETTSLVTLEDPVEVQLPFATQTQINPKLDMNFAQTLRSVLRQDPGALMVGEVRDRETAEITTQAGLTGHLLLTTIHVESAAGSFARLEEMKIEPFLLASSCAGTLAQRLLRRLCTHCKIPQVPSDDERKRFFILGVDLPDLQFFQKLGCERCEGRGYSGRIPIAELLVMTNTLREAVKARASTEEVHRLAIEEGMTPLIEAGMRVVAEGKSTLQELLRVAG